MNNLDKKYIYRKMPSVNIDEGIKREKLGESCYRKPRNSQQTLADADGIGKNGMKKYKCIAPNCGKEFYWKYRRDYCPDVANTCYNNAKSIRQSVLDGIVKKTRKGLYANYKIFREYLPESGRIELDYDIALKKGFDEHAYYGSYKNPHNEFWHMVGEYYFTISHQDKIRLLHILKIK